MNKQYNSPMLHIVCISNNDIVTTSINTHNTQGNCQQLAPGNRRSIWD